MGISRPAGKTILGTSIHAHPVLGKGEPGVGRAGRLSRSMEDYLEAIYVLSREKGYARVMEIARALGVKPPSVTQMVRKMSEKGLVTFKRYGRIMLTEVGESVARRIIGRHRLLKAFLTALGVSNSVAEEDACAMEHVLHDETVRVFRRLAEFLLNAPDGLKCLECLKRGQYLCLAGR